MKKLAHALVLLALPLTLAACGSSDKSDDGNKAKDPVAEEEGGITVVVPKAARVVTAANSPASAELKGTWEFQDSVNEATPEGQLTVTGSLVISDGLVTMVTRCKLGTSRELVAKASAPAIFTATTIDVREENENVEVDGNLDCTSTIDIMKAEYKVTDSGKSLTLKVLGTNEVSTFTRK